MAIGPVLLANRRHLARHPWVVMLAIGGIALGVMMSTAIDLAIASTRRAFTESVAGVTGHATHQIVAGPSGIPDADFARVRAHMAPCPSAPVVESIIALPDHPGRVLRLTGVDPFSEGPFRPLDDGTAAGLDAPTATLLTTPASIVLTAETAAELGVVEGSPLRVLIGTDVKTVTICRLLRLGDALSQRALRDVAVCDISSAQELLGRNGVIDRIDLLVARDREPRLASLVLPAGASLQRASARAQALEQMTSAFHLNLTAMGLLALVVGVFLIYNTADFLVVQRRDQLARLRLHGASRADCGLAILLEALACGVLGSLVGALIGIGAAGLLVQAVSATISDLYFSVAVRTVALPWWLLVGNILIGTVASLIAAAIPAYVAMRTQPAAGMARSAQSERSLAVLPRLALVGVALVLGAAGLLRWGAQDIISGFAAMGLTIAGWALLVPYLLSLATTIAAVPLGAVFGPLALIATRSARATLGRTGVAVAALAVATAASLGVGIMVDSFRHALIEWLNATLRADVYVSAPRTVAARINEVSLDPAVIDHLRSVPGVETVITKRDAHPMAMDLSPDGQGRIDLIAFDIPPRARLSFTFIEADPEVWSRFTQGALLMTEPFAARHHLHRGDAITLQTDHGIQRFGLVAIVRDYSSDQGSVFIDLDAYHRWWSDRGISALSAFAMPGVSADTLIERMHAATAPHLLQMSSNQQLRRESLEVFDRTFAITRVIRILAGTVAFLGVLFSLLALSLEKAREMAVLRMHGCSAAQIAAVFGGQALVSGIAAGLLALPLGVVLAELLIVVINHRSFGWSFSLRVAPGNLVLAVGLAVLAALLAAIYPAWRASRISAAQVLRGE